MTTPFQGGQALGEMIFGGRQRGNSDVFLQRLRENYNTQRAMDEAANSQIQRIARESIKSSDIAAARAGDLEAQARLGEAALRTADTPNLRNITGGFSDFDEAGYRRGAVEKARLGDMAGAQAELIGLADGPLKVNAIDAGYQLNPYEVGGKATPTQGKLGEIALSGAKVATEGARQDELGARADVSRAKAKAGGFAPSRSGGGGGGKGRSASEAKAIVSKLETEMGRPLTSAEVAQVYSGGDFNFQAEPLGNGVAGNGNPGGKAPAGVDQKAYAKAMQIRADAMRAIQKGAPKGKVADRLRERGYPKLAEWIMGGGK